MINIDKDYLITVDLKNTKVKSDKTIFFYNTDLNICNIFIKLICTDKDKTIPEDLIVEFAVLKPETDEFKPLDATLISKEDLLYQVDLTTDYFDIVGKYSCEIRVSGTIENELKCFTSEEFDYVVKPNITAKLNKKIKNDKNLPILEKLIKDVKEITDGINKNEIQMKRDENLVGDNKTIVGAINQLREDVNSGIGGGTVELKDYQKKNDEFLNTDEKTITGGINEVNNKIKKVQESQIELDKDDVSFNGIDDISHDELNTTNKTLIGAINEVNTQCKDIASNTINTISSKILTTVLASNIQLDNEITINNVSINEDRRYYIEFLGSKKLCNLMISEDMGICIMCSIGSYHMTVFNDSTDIKIGINKINTDDITTDTFTDLIIYEEEVKYLDNKYLETDLVLQNSISMGRVGDIGSGSSAIGVDVTASNFASHAEGNNTIALSDCSHAEGYGTTASGNTSHAEGSESTASGGASHAEGDTTTASGDNSHAEGNGTLASGDNSHAEGNGTLASGNSSHAEGSSTLASGDNSHAEGYNTKAVGDNSHAEGYDTKSSGAYSHSEGKFTTASGSNSHAEGSNTIASSFASHAEGYGTTASSNQQHVQGKFNIEDTEGKYAHIVGNGSVNNKSNAHTLDWEGNAWYAGKLSQEGTPTEDKDLTTKKYVDDKISSFPQLTFNESGELVVTINGVSKTFVPKS